MTNNEIIKFLQSKQIPQCGDKEYTADEEYEAYQRAIDALEQQPCGDAISRQAVIKGIEELKKSPWATANRSHGYEYLISEALDVVKDLCVKQLPSVTQKSAESEDKTE
jgi:hypothetical protein